MARRMVALAALCLLAPTACADEVAANPLDDLLVAIDATRAVPTGRYSTTAPQQSTEGEYDADGVSVRTGDRPELRVIRGVAFVPSALFPAVPASTSWLTVPIDHLGPLENRSPGLADEVAALQGTPPPGIGPALAALRTSTSATHPEGKPLRARLDLTNLKRLAPRDRDAVVAWAGLWARQGGTRDLFADVSVGVDGRIETVVFDPDGTTAAGPSTLSLTDLGAPVEVVTPPLAELSPLR